MRIAIVTALLAICCGCATEAVIKQVENTEACGPGTARLVPTESKVWFVLCPDGRVSWLEDDDTE
jgi:hypothetical protein